MPLKFLSNFFTLLNNPLSNCEVCLTLTWSENCVITSKATREADPDADPLVAGINNPRNVVFKITDCKLYVPLVTLSAENDNKLLEQLKGLKEKSHGINLGQQFLIRLKLTILSI